MAGAGFKRECVWGGQVMEDREWAGSKKKG